AAGTATAGSSPIDGAGGLERATRRCAGAAWCGRIFPVSGVDGDTRRWEVGLLQRRGATLRVLGLGAVLALALTACGGEKSTSGGGQEGTQQGGTLVFAASADPVSMDPAFISDGESIRHRKSR